MLKNQKFGVEVEMTGITRANVARIVSTVLQSRTSGDNGGSYHTRIIKDSQEREWKVMRDSSINEQRKDGGTPTDEHKVEFVTPPLQYEDIDLLQKIVRELKKAGAFANNSCGIHIHVDGANHNAQSLRRLVNFMTARQDLIYEALEISARANRWCQKLSPELLTTMKKRNELSNHEVEEMILSILLYTFSSRILHPIQHSLVNHSNAAA